MMNKIIFWLSAYIKKRHPVFWQRLKHVTNNRSHSKIPAVADLGVYEKQIYDALMKFIEQQNTARKQ